MRALFGNVQDLEGQSLYRYGALHFRIAPVPLPLVTGSASSVLTLQGLEGPCWMRGT
jgi:hypothetical protein